MKHFIFAYYISALFLPSIPIRLLSQEGLSFHFFSGLSVLILVYYSELVPKMIYVILIIGLGVIWGGQHRSPPTGRGLESISHLKDHFSKDHSAHKKGKSTLVRPDPSKRFILSLGFKKKFKNTIDTYTPKNLKEYYFSMFAVEKYNYDIEISKLKRIGIFHLLVMSGFHVNLFSYIMLILFSAPIRILSIFNVISPIFFKKLRSQIFYFQLVSLFYINISLGVSHPLLRATLFSCVLNQGMIGLYPRTNEGVTLIGFIHLLLFPSAGLSTSFLLSWVISLFFIFTDRGSRSIWSKLKSLFMVQLMVSGTSVFLLGESSLQSFVINLFFSFLYPFLVSSMIVNAIGMVSGMEFLLGRFDYEYLFFNLLISVGNRIGDWPIKPIISLRILIGVLISLVLCLWIARAHPEFFDRSKKSSSLE